MRIPTIFTINNKYKNFAIIMIINMREFNLRTNCYKNTCRTQSHLRNYANVMVFDSIFAQKLQVEGPL